MSSGRGTAEGAPAVAASGSNASAHLALLLAQTCFGLFPVSKRWLFEPGAFSPFAVGAWRMLFAAGSLALCASIVHAGRWRIARQDLPRFVACALLGVTVNMSLYLEGLKRSTATEAGLVMCLIPVFTFGIAAFAGQERFRAGRAIGIGVALAGASLLFWAERPELVRAHGLGNALMAVNALSYASYLVVVRPLARKYPPMVVIAWVFVLSLPFVPLLVARETWGSGAGVVQGAAAFLAPPGASAGAWWALAFTLVFPTTVAYLANAFALSRVRASTTAAYIYIQPAITGVAAWLLIGEDPTPVTFLSAALVFAGIWLVARPGRPGESGSATASASSA
jgi:drug/metabolite transporter (DMT)-like permease